MKRSAFSMLIWALFAASAQDSKTNQEVNISNLPDQISDQIAGQVFEQEDCSEAEKQRKKKKKKALDFEAWGQLVGSDDDDSIKREETTREQREKDSEE